MRGEETTCAKINAADQTEYTSRKIEKTVFVIDVVVFVADGTK